MVQFTLAKAALCASTGAILAAAGPVKRSASTYAGLSTSNLYPPSGTAPNPTLFPPESVVGYQQATPTGVEPFAVETAAAYPVVDNIYPLIVPAPLNGTKDFDIAKYWGNLSPQYSVDSSVYGLPDASPLIPDHCEIVQAHTYFRHGARYPTTGAPPSTFAAKVHNASLAGFNATNDLAFLNTWTYKLGAELLTPFGRKQNFNWGVGARQLYGKLLNNFTETGTLPVFRTQSQDRMVKTMLNFVAGFFGVPEYQDQVNVEITVEANGYNNTGAPYSVCPNANNARGSLGSTAATAFAKPYYDNAAARLNKSLSGALNLTATDINAMLQLCAYETDALGYSDFCPLFTEAEFQAFEQSFDISFAGNNGFASPVSAAQGKGYLEEFIARLNHTLITKYDSETNSTLDSNNKTFPLNQSIYADAAHEVSIMDALVALNLTALAADGAPTVTTLSANHTYVASRVVPFGTIFQAQVLECSSSQPTKQIRMIVNDAVVPLTYPGCAKDPNGLCAYDTVLAGLIQRNNEIDFDYACNGNYSVPAYGSISNGLPPKA
ncbi:hypothetical protein JCM10908_005400 [Rhodotorula pacifica]|uniref:histidine phosphatase family protein n=1 Tax=Rhodotorula pacifica TaxID=1495444 RepID=UPI00317B743C